MPRTIISLSDEDIAGRRESVQESGSPDDEPADADAVTDRRPESGVDPSKSCQGEKRRSGYMPPARTARAGNGTGAVTSAPSLAYVAVVVDHPGDVASFFEHDLGLPRTDVASPAGAVPWIEIGESAITLFGPGHAFTGGAVRSGVHHVAIESSDPPALAVNRGFSADGATPGLGGGGQVELDARATCGIETRLCEPIDAGRHSGTSDHVERIDHLGVACEDNRAAGAVFTGQLGCPVESTQTDFEIAQAIESFTSDKYGVVYHSRPPEPIGGLRVSFLTVGDCELELLQPFDPRAADRRTDEGPQRGAPGNTRGDKGAIARYIERRGPGLHHIALKVPDIDTLLPRLAASGRRMIDLAGRPGSRRARIGFVHPASLGGLLLHFVERDDR